VGLVHGVHYLTVGADVSVWLDPAYVYLFNEAGTLAAPATYAVAA
jgi:glycerol transport system ATP-binding protein